MRFIIYIFHDETLNAAYYYYMVTDILCIYSVWQLGAMRKDCPRDTVVIYGFTTESMHYYLHFSYDTAILYSCSFSFLVTIKTRAGRL